MREISSYLRQPRNEDSSLKPQQSSSIATIGYYLNRFFKSRSIQGITGSVRKFQGDTHSGKTTEQLVMANDDYSMTREQISMHLGLEPRVDLPMENEQNSKPTFDSQIALEVEASSNRRKMPGNKLPPLSVEVSEANANTAQQNDVNGKLQHPDESFEGEGIDRGWSYEVALAIALAGIVISGQMLHPVRAVDVEKALPTGPSPTEPGEIVQYSLGAPFYVPKYENELDTAREDLNGETPNVPTIPLTFYGR